MTGPRLAPRFPVLPAVLAAGLVGVLVGATSLVGVGAALTSAAAAAPAAGPTYVALGDSYAAGYGLPPSAGSATGDPVPGCAQTTGDYPHLLAASPGLTLTDVTCSGATTTNITQPQRTPAGTAPPQLAVFDTVQPDLVTITIGGNDLGFAAISANCLAESATGPVFSHPTYASCSDWYTSTASDGGAALNPYDRLSDVVAKVGDAIAQVQAAAPAAHIAVIAYPAIAPDAADTPAGGCFAANALPQPVQLPGLPISVSSAYPFTDADGPFLQALQQQLDEGIATTAAAHGAAYADIYPSSLAHSACQPEATRWVEPIIPGDPAGTNTLHPNLAGTTAMAAVLAPVVSALLAPPTSSPATSTAPTTTAPATSSGPTGTRHPPLAATGPRAPVGWFVGIGVLLIAAGVLSLRLARFSEYHARH